MAAYSTHVLSQLMLFILVYCRVTACLKQSVMPSDKLLRILFVRIFVARSWHVFHEIRHYFLSICCSSFVTTLSVANEFMITMMMMKNDR